MTTDRALYQIRVRGRIDPSWSDRLGGMTIESGRSGELPITTLTGEVVDQSALSGILSALVDLHVTVLSVENLDTPVQGKDL